MYCAVVMIGRPPVASIYCVREETYRPRREQVSDHELAYVAGRTRRERKR